MSLTLVIVHRDQPHRCLRTIDAFRAQAVETDIVVIDNGSEPAALDILRAGHPDVPIIPTAANLGFGPGANVGLIRWLAGEIGGTGQYVAVAPHDALPAPGCVARIIDAMNQRPRAGLASAEYGDDEVPFVDRNFGGITKPATRGSGWEPAGYPHGTLLVARRACLEEIGVFDERYFAYCEEADLGVRARNAGWEVGIVWGALVVNPHTSGQVPALDYLMLRNSLLLVREHSGRYPAFVRLVVAAVSTLWLAARPSRRPPFFSFSARQRALADFLRGRYGPPPPSLLAKKRDSQSTTAA